MHNLKYVIHILIILFFLSGFRSYGQDDMLRMGHYFTEDEANLKLKEFASTWNDLESWENRAAVIRQGIIEGMKLDKMPKIVGNFYPQITNSRTFDGYIVENIRIESFPGFYITGNIYRPIDVPKKKSAAILLPHGHGKNGRLDATRGCSLPEAQILRDFGVGALLAYG